MAKVNPEQLAALRKVAKCANYLEARAMVEESGILPSTTFVSAEEKRIALYARSACYNPADFGKDGKLNEIAHRVNASRSPMPWKAFNARQAGLSDQTFKLEGITYSFEHKTSNGDFFHTSAETLEDAFLEWGKNPHKLLYWDTQYFTLVIPANELLEALNGYCLGWRTFFRLNGNIVYCQPFRTSQKKLAFLEQLADKYSEYYNKFAEFLERPKGGR